ncbi:hydrogenase expression protein, partial [bacterium]|nr:hydrogenase expression protein [bacterium]
MLPSQIPLKPGKLDADLLATLLGSLGGDPSVVVGPGIGRDVAVIDVGAPELLLLKSDPITFATDEIGF